MSEQIIAFYGIKDQSRGAKNIFTHDHNLTFWQQGRVRQYIHLERLTEKKHDHRAELFFENIVDQLPLDLSKPLQLIGVNSFAGNSFISKNGKIRFDATPHKFLEKFQSAWASLSIQKKRYKPQAWLCSHELAHVGTCLPFYGSFLENSLLVHFDGGASQSNFSAFVYKKGQIKMVVKDWEMAYLSKLFNHNPLSFYILNQSFDTHCDLAGKLMGFACLGTYDPAIAVWLQQNDFFSKTTWSKSRLLKKINAFFGSTLSFYDTKDINLQNIAATFQYIFTEKINERLAKLAKKYGCKQLYYAGGCALSIVSNTALVSNGVFEQIFIPPCPSDSGLSLGAAAMYAFLEKKQIDLHNPYLNNWGVSSSYSFDEQTIRSTAQQLIKGAILGVCNGAAEIGPRALGNRSIIALANSPALAQKVSMQIKKREWYRPIAPIMLAEVAKKVTEKPPLLHLTKYMLLDYRIKPTFQADLAGVIHQNQTARIQTLSDPEENPFMFALLTYLYEKHHILALINTSFNIQGQPIVQTAEQAQKYAPTIGLDGLVLNGKLYVF